jgi:hypothetical protein
MKGRSELRLTEGFSDKEFQHTEKHWKFARKDLTSLNKVISERAAMETAFSWDFLYKTRSWSRSSFIICRFPG